MSNVPGIFRPLTEADIPQIANIDQQASDSWSSAMFHNELKREQCWRYVWQEETTSITGFILGIIVGDEAEIFKLSVLPHSRRRGIGKMLLTRSLELLRQKNMATCFLELRPSNTAAMHLYQGYGFTPCGVRPQYYRAPIEDAVLMKKSFGVTTREKHQRT